MPHRTERPRAPLLIQRPQLQRPLHRRLYQLVTLVAWVGWIYLFLPLITFLLWIGGVHTAWVEIGIARNPFDAESLRMISLLALGSALALMLWSEIERRRFVGLNRRKGVSRANLPSIAEATGTAQPLVDALQAGRRCRIDFAADGRIVGVAREDPEPVPRPLQPQSAPVE